MLAGLLQAVKWDHLWVGNACWILSIQVWGAVRCINTDKSYSTQHVHVWDLQPLTLLYSQCLILWRCWMLFRTGRKSCAVLGAIAWHAVIYIVFLQDAGAFPQCNYRFQQSEWLDHNERRGFRSNVTGWEILGICPLKTKKVKWLPNILCHHRLVRFRRQSTAQQRRHNKNNNWKIALVLACTSRKWHQAPSFRHSVCVCLFHESNDTNPTILDHTRGKLSVIAISGELLMDKVCPVPSFMVLVSWFGHVPGWNRVKGVALYVHMI